MSKKEKRKNYSITIGSKLKKVLDEQKEIVKSWGWNILEISDWEAGEILAEKIIEKGILK